MTRLLSTVGISVTALYVVAGLALLNTRLGSLSEMPLNEVGDFLAGVFGPLTIFWLVLGFFQQGIELKQNTRALELQAKELRHSVEQQRQLVEVSKNQFDAELEALRYERTRQEQSSLAVFICHGVGGTHKGNGEHHFRTQIKNTGHAASAVSILANRKMRKLKPDSVPYWDRGTDVDLEFEYENWIPKPDTIVTIVYTDGLGRVNQHHLSFTPDLSGQTPTVNIARYES